MFGRRFQCFVLVAKANQPQSCSGGRDGCKIGSAGDSIALTPRSNVKCDAPACPKLAPSLLAVVSVRCSAIHHKPLTMHQPRANWTEQVCLPSRSLVAKAGRLRSSVTAVAAATAKSGVARLESPSRRTAACFSAKTATGPSGASATCNTAILAVRSSGHLARRGPAGWEACPTNQVHHRRIRPVADKMPELPTALTNAWLNVNHFTNAHPYVSHAACNA